MVDDANEVQVTLQDGREFNAKVIGLDPKSPTLRWSRLTPTTCPPSPWPTAENVQVGDVVLAIGNPFGVGQTVTHGHCQRDRPRRHGHRGLRETSSKPTPPLTRATPAGRWWMSTGRLIGINTAILSRTGGNLGIGFAVPSDLAHRVMTDLLKYGYVVRGYLGVETQNLTPELATEFKLHRSTGALVGGVAPNGPAEKAGLEVGDVITRFDGKDVRDARQLKLSVAEVKPGQIVPVEVLRDGSAKPLRVAIGQASNNDLLAKVDRTTMKRIPARYRA